MKVSDAMTRGVVSAKPADTLQQVARRMSEVDSGVMPVMDGGTLAGLVTDRDIVVRAVAEGLGLDTPVYEIMTRPVETVAETDDLEDAVAKMAEMQIRRVLVTGASGGVVGVLSLGDVAREAKAKQVGHALEEISDPGDQPAR